MSSSLVGIGCLLFFAVSQGARDAFFGNAFQSVSFLLVAALAFGVSTTTFTLLSAVRRPQDVRRLCASPGMLTALNVTGAAAWLSFLLGLKFLEPAVVAMLYNGIGSLVVLAIASLGWSGAMAAKKSSALERFCYLGIAGTLAAISIVVLTNQSGLSLTHFTTSAIALGMVAFGGAMITLSHLVARWYTDQGVASDALMGTRYVLTFLAAGSLEILSGDAAARPAADRLWLLTLTAVGLIVVPGFVLQLGVARTSPLAVNVFRALGPVFVFAVQQLDGRLRFSGMTLACIVAFCVFSVGASVLRGLSEVKGVGSVVTTK